LTTSPHDVVYVTRA